MIACVFPGQGSQHPGMGQSLFDEVPEYAHHETQIDALCGYSMRRLCLQDPGNQLKQTQYTQPSLYVVNALHYYKTRRDGLQPTYLAGHSLGEYNALLAAGAFDFLTGLRLVCKRGEIMARAGNGGMAAVVGLTAERVARVLSDAGLNEIDIANFNAPQQIVISGSVQQIQRAALPFEAAGTKVFLPLSVSAAFHSRYMVAAARDFAEFLRPMVLKAPQVPVIANATAEPYPEDPSGEGIKALLVRQISHPVQWTQSIRRLLAGGINEFRECGPGNVLTGLIRQIRQDAGAAQIAPAVARG